MNCKIEKVRAYLKYHLNCMLRVCFKDAREFNIDSRLCIKLTEIEESTPKLVSSQARIGLIFKMKIIFIAFVFAILAVFEVIEYRI